MSTAAPAETNYGKFTGSCCHPPREMGSWYPESAAYCRWDMQNGETRERQAMGWVRANSVGRTVRGKCVPTRSCEDDSGRDSGRPLTARDLAAAMDWSYSAAQNVLSLCAGLGWIRREAGRIWYVADPPDPSEEDELGEHKANGIICTKKLSNGINELHFRLSENREPSYEADMEGCEQFTKDLHADLAAACRAIRAAIEHNTAAGWGTTPESPTPRRTARFSLKLEIEGEWNSCVHGKTTQAVHIVYDSETGTVHGAPSLFGFSDIEAEKTVAVGAASSPSPDIQTREARAPAFVVGSSTAERKAGELASRSSIEVPPEVAPAGPFPAAVLDELVEVYRQAGAPVPEKHKQHALQMIHLIPREKRARIANYCKWALVTGKWPNPAKTKSLLNVLRDGDWDVEITARTLPDAAANAPPRRQTAAEAAEERFRRKYATHTK